MPWNSSGTFNRKTTTVSPATSGTTVDSADMNSYTTDVTGGINACRAKNGENAATAHLPMGGFKHTNVADGTARTEYSSVGQGQDGSTQYAADTGAANAYEVDLSPVVTTNVVGRKTSFKVKAGGTNTGASTLDLNGIGAESIKRQDGDALVAGDIVAARIYTVTWDGTNYILENQTTQGVFVNNSNDNPNISDTIYDLSAHPFASWSDIGDTTSGATDTWAALDSVPAGVSWIEVGVNIHASMSSGLTTILALTIHARANGGAQTTGQDNMVIDERQDIVNNTVAMALYSFATVKIPVNTTTGMFDLIQAKTGTFNSNTSALVLKGYGWN